MSESYKRVLSKLDTVLKGHFKRYLQDLQLYDAQHWNYLPLAKCFSRSIMGMLRKILLKLYTVTKEIKRKCLCNTMSYMALVKVGVSVHRSLTVCSTANMGLLGQGHTLHL